MSDWSEAFEQMKREAATRRAIARSLEIKKPLIRTAKQIVLEVHVSLPSRRKGKFGAWALLREGERSKLHVESPKTKSR